MPHTKINSKRIKDLYVRVKLSIKLLGGIVGINLHELGLGNSLLDITPKHMQQKKNKLDSPKLKTFMLKKTPPTHYQQSKNTIHRRKYLQTIYLISI